MKSVLCTLCHKEYAYLEGTSNLQLISETASMCDYSEPSFSSIVRTFKLEYSPFIYALYNIVNYYSYCQQLPFKGLYNTNLENYPCLWMLLHCISTEKPSPSWNVTFHVAGRSLPEAVPQKHKSHKGQHHFMICTAHSVWMRMWLCG